MAKRKIPGGITPEDFMELRAILMRILKEIDSWLRTAGGREVDMPKEVHVRLNETGKDYPYPIFVGWVEDKKLAEKRSLIKNHPDPGLYRFGDDVLSNVYAEAFWRAEEKHHFPQRNWEIEMHDKRPGEKATDPKSGNLYQTCQGIVVQEGQKYRVVGTLVIGFPRRPEANITIDRARDCIEIWARPPSIHRNRRKAPPFESPLLTFLRRYELGGRILKLKANRQSRAGRR